MLRLTGYLPSDHIESQISEDHAHSDSNLANQKATFLWNNTQYYRNKIHAVDTSYHKETLYCEQSIVIKQANLDIERVRDNYYCAKTSSFSAADADNDNNEHVPASMQSLGKAKLQCEDGKKEVLFNAVYDLEYQKEFIIAQPLYRQECTIANTFHDTEGIMGSIPITLSTHKRQQQQQQQQQPQSQPPKPQCRVRPRPTTNTKQNSQNSENNHSISIGLFAQISSFVASKLAKKNNTGGANSNANNNKADHQSDNKYVRGYKVEMERCVLHDHKKVTSEKPNLEKTFKSNSNNYKSGNSVLDVHQYLASEV